MFHGEFSGVLAGAIALGAIHGIEPGHGWPVAAAYALDRSNAWIAGLAASLLIGIGHLISSLAVVAAFFLADAALDLSALREPIELADGVAIGGPLGIVAGLLLIGLGIREYRGGHGHAHFGDLEGEGTAASDGHGHHDHDGGQEHGSDEGEGSGAHDHAAEHGGHAHPDEHGGHDHATEHSDHDHATEHSDHDHATEHSDHDHATEHDDHDHAADYDERDEHAHGHGDAMATAADQGLMGIAWAAFLLGFAHEEEFEILALCAGSTHCLTLMMAYALTVIVAIVGATLILVGGYQRFEDQVGHYAGYLPLVSASVLVVMGLGFLLGVL